VGAFLVPWMWCVAHDPGLAQPPGAGQTCAGKVIALRRSSRFFAERYRRTEALSMFKTIPMCLNILNVVARFDLEFRSDLAWSVQKWGKIPKNRVHEEGFAPNPNRPENITEKLLSFFDEQNSKIQFVILLHMVMSMYWK
jgi:hypothetical protein